MLTVIDKAKMFREIVNEMADLYEKKNANYGDSFGQLFDTLGPISGLVPLHNKLDRATSLIKGNQNNFESLEDTFEDMACYSIMNLMETRLRATTVGEKGELTTAVFIEPEKTKEPLDLPTYNLNDGKWYYKGVLADGWCYNKDGRMTGQGYRDGQPISDMVLRTYDTTPHHFIPNIYKTTTVKKSEPVDFNVDPSITLLKNPCLDCPWNNQLWIGGSHPYVGDSPCQWCEHGTKVTCENINYCTSITVDNTDNIKLKATSSTKLEDSFVKADPSIVASTMIDEYYDLDDLTVEEMAEAEREERSVWENIYSQYLTKRGRQLMDKIRVYLAGSMFCEADRMYNAYLAERIRERFGDRIDLYVPQENQSINDKTKCADSHAIFWGDYNRLQDCDIFIARIDGDIPPSGTSAEIGIMSQRIQHWIEGLRELIDLHGDKIHDGFYDGYASDYYTMKKGRCPIILGLCTDSRNPKRTYLDAKNELMKTADYESQYCYFNLFTIGCIKVNGKLTTSVKELVDALEESIYE